MAAGAKEMMIGLVNSEPTEKTATFKWLVDDEFLTSNEYDDIIDHDQGKDCIAFIKGNLTSTVVQPQTILLTWWLY